MEDKRITVLSVCTSDSVGGAARAAYRIHQGVNNLGVNSSMLVKDKRSSDTSVHALDEFLPSGVLFHICDWFANKVKNKWQHFQWNHYPARERIFMSDMRSTRVFGAMNKLDYDVLHLHWINLRFFPLEELKRTGRPIIWTLHDSWPFCGICHYTFKCEGYMYQCGNCPQLHSANATDLSHKIWSRKKRIYRNLDLHIVTPSNWLAGCARNSSLLGKFPVTVIPNCIETDVFRPLSNGELSNRWDWLVSGKKDKRYILFGAVNATDDKIKGFSNLLSALNELSQKNIGNCVELVVFGADRPIDGMPGSIPTHYVGYIRDIDELVSLYNIADVVVVPSLTENLSCTIMESLSCGTPVAAFDIGGNGDMIDHMKNGYLAKELDDADLAEGIAWCLDNNEDESLSGCARKKVLDNYTPEIVCQQYKKLYYSLISR